MSALHASAVRLDGLGILIRGPSGSGKSRLAMALLAMTVQSMTQLDQAGATGVPIRLVTDQPHQPTDPLHLDQRPTALIGDDYLELTSMQKGLVASPAKGLEGLIEVRGLGILAMPWCAQAPIHLAVDLVPLAQMERLPESMSTLIAGHQLPHILLPIGDLAHQMLLVRLALHTLPAEG